MFRAIRASSVFVAAATLVIFGARAADDPSTSAKAGSSKKDKDGKPAKQEPEFNTPPKGATILALGQFKGQIVKGSDGKTFSMEVDLNGRKKEVEVNLAAYTKVRLSRQSDYDDKGNPRKSAPVVTPATADDIRGGMKIVVTVSGTRDGKWLVAKVATVTNE
jgi:hypothetical protein